MKPQKPQFNIELRETEAEGIYSNMVMVGHTPSEIILDFARIMPGAQKGRVYSRIIMTPPHAKMLHKALGDNLKKYETQYGDIKIHGKEQKNIGFDAGSNDEDKS